MSFGEKYGKVVSPSEFHNYISLANDECRADEVSLKESTDRVIKNIDKEFEEIKKARQKS